MSKSLLSLRPYHVLISGFDLSLGYADGCADIAYALQSVGETIVTPLSQPDPTKDLDWSFPDTVSGIREAIEKGANTLWANTTLHSTHAVVELKDELTKNGIRLIGQNPLTADKYDDKEWTNRWLSSQNGLQKYFPRSLLYRRGNEDEDKLGKFPLPAVAKPIKGRGSHGVVKISTPEEVKSATYTLLKESEAVLIEVSSLSAVNFTIIS